MRKLKNYVLPFTGLWWSFPLSLGCLVLLTSCYSPRAYTSEADSGDIPDLDQPLVASHSFPAVDRVLNDKERQRMQEYLAQHVRPEDVLFRFTSPAGDEIDCVDIQKQPALRRPDMAKHVIEYKPRGFVREESKEQSIQEERERPDLQSREQEFTSGGQSCPPQSVPMQHLTMNILKNFETLEAFFYKTPPKDGPTSLHQYAKADKWVDNWGGESVFNLWKPYTERADEFTLSQMWVVRGSDSNKETIEGGWQKYRDLYGDWRSRLFIYFTPDNYGSGGCYNLTCGAFVQVNNSVYIGGGFTNYSSHGGAQYTIKLLWYKDGESGHWWLRYGDTWVGYYPRSLFDGNGLRDFAARTSFGGEIINRNISSQHTRTDMGSGYMPSFGFRWAAYQRAIRYVDTSNFYRQASGMSIYVSDADCYDIQLNSSNGSWEQYFYFGGWGYNSQCE
jgi:hypothetical protein